MTDLRSDWIDGFLMVGNQPVLDLLNTRLLVGEDEQEMLTDTSALVRWLQAAGLVAPPLREKLKHWHGQAEARHFLRDLIVFRELLRSAVFAFEEGNRPRKAFVIDLNARLSAHPYRIALDTSGKSMSLQQAEGTSVADTLWGALLAEVVKLFTQADPSRVRKCESCVVHFQDTSKKSSRRWCSMLLCGNRLKVAAYQQRRRLRRRDGDR